MKTINKQAELLQEADYISFNNLFNSTTLADISAEIKKVGVTDEKLAEIYKQLRQQYEEIKDDLKGHSEGGLEQKFIGKVLEILEWHSLPQQSMKSSGDDKKA